MADYGLYKNAEGYADPTAAETLKNIAKPGEIYEYKGREVLIVKNQGGYSNTLALSTNPGIDRFEVAGRYTQTGMISYAFNDLLGAMVERITDSELKAVVLAINIYADGEPHKEIYTTKAVADKCNFLESENKKLKKKFALMRGMYDDLLNKFIDKFGGCEDG